MYSQRRKFFHAQASDIKNCLSLLNHSIIQCVTTLHLPRAPGMKERLMDEEVKKRLGRLRRKKNYEMIRDHDTDTRFYHVNDLSLQIDIRCIRIGSVSCVRSLLPLK